MKKSIAVISGTVLTLGATGLVTNVQADDVTSQEVTTTQTEQKAAPVTKEQVSSAKQATDKATTDVEVLNRMLMLHKLQLTKIKQLSQMLKPK